MTPREIAEQVVATGYQQLSRRKREVARVPPGMTALEALHQVDPDKVAALLNGIEQTAADEYRRLHAKGKDRIFLTREEFGEYLRLTGRTGAKYVNE